MRHISAMNNEQTKCLQPSGGNTSDFQSSDWQVYKNRLYEIPNYSTDCISIPQLTKISQLKRGVSVDEVYKQLDAVCGGDKLVWITALTFYMRNYDKIDGVCEGRGEKLISFHMMMWLFDNHRKTFMDNYTSFILDIGCYKDCLVLAHMCMKKNYSDADVRTMLTPMAISLMDDENKLLRIINRNKSPDKNYDGLSDTILHIHDAPFTRASKWAPREGKSYSTLIPYLKQLCNITGPQSNMKWRKYIQHISRCESNPDTVEYSLSNHQYNNIDFTKLPHKSEVMYTQTFIENDDLCGKFFKYRSEVSREKYTNPQANKTCNQLNIIEKLKYFLPLITYKQ